MANITADDITYTILQQRKSADRNLYNFQLGFGNSSLTYPAGGVPVSIAKLGCPNIVESLTVYDKGTSGYEWSYDAANKKLVAIQAPVQSHTHNFILKGGQAAAGTHSHDLKVIGGQAASTTNNIANYATSILGKQEATNATYAGVDSATKGGVLSGAAGNTLVAAYGTDTIGKEAATDATILGVDSATKGGVVSATLAAAPGSQPSAVAIAAQVLRCEVMGW